MVALHDRGEVLFLHRTGTDSWSGLWWLPGGGVERDESAETAAIREVEEETGIVLPVFDRIMEVVEPTGTGAQFRVHLFAAAVAKRAPRLNAEHDAWRWAPPRTFLDQDLGGRAQRDPSFAAWQRAVADPFLTAVGRVVAGSDGPR